MALTDKLTAIADAIRGKTGKADGLTLEQMATEIAGIQAGGGGKTKFYVAGQAGAVYTDETINEDIFNQGKALTLYTPHVVFKPVGSWTLSAGSSMYRDATELVSFTSDVLVGGDNMFRACSKLETFILTAGGAINNAGWCLNYCTALKNAQFGSIGNPITSFKNADYFRNCTQAGLIITVYVNAATLAEAMTVCPAIPGMAVNATVIYRSSVTGEVITE